MQLNPYINFNGNCEAAFKFYEKALGGKILMKSTFGETPMKGKVPPEMHGKVIHMRMLVGEDILMGSDAMPGQYSQPKGFSVTLNFKETAETERVFAALSEGATVQMPIQETFWAKRFGMLVDQFGIPWMINCEKVPQ